MATVTIDSIVLPDDTIWVDQFKWNKIDRNFQRSIAGNVLIQNATKYSGRPLTLNLGWISRATLISLETLRDNPAAPTFTVVLIDEASFTCCFNPGTDEPIQVVPIVERPEYIPSDYMAVILSLMIVEDDPETGTVSLCITKGDDYSRTFAFRNSAGEVIDLTGFSFAAQCRNGPEITDPLLFDFTTTVYTPTGVVTISLTSTETSALNAGRGYWSLKETVGAVTTTRALGSVLVRAAPTA